MKETPRADSPDVRQLRRQDLPERSFPGGRDQDFRIYFAPEVHKELWKHAEEDTSVEICGVLVGRWGSDSDGPFVAISASIRGDAAESKFAEVTFTHETWAKINAQMDTRFADSSIVGWYHTHPDFGIFLSDRDRFIQEHFFSGPGQVAHVIDPIRHIEGVFIWKDGKPTLGRHFWVGDQVLLGPSQGSEERTKPQAGAGSSPAAASDTSARAAPEVAFLPTPARLMIYLAVFLVGYYFSGLRSSWEQDRLVEGVVAHYGLWDGLRPGLRDELDGLGLELVDLSRRIESLALGEAKREGMKAQDGKDPWQEVRSRLASASERVGGLRARYCVGTDQQLQMLKAMSEKLQALTDERRAAAKDPVGKATQAPAQGTTSPEPRKGDSSSSKPGAGPAPR